MIIMDINGYLMDIKNVLLGSWFCVEIQIQNFPSGHRHFVSGLDDNI